MQMTTGVALRKLEWPLLPPVDLTTEFHWLIHGDDTEQHGDNANVQDQDADAQDDDELQFSRYQLSDLDRSPYRQLLNQPKEKRPPLSPAQRAAKKILKLKLELGCLDDDEHKLSAYSQQQHFLSDFADLDTDFRREFQDQQPKKSKKQASDVVVRAKAIVRSSNSPPAKTKSRGPQPGQPPAKTTREPPTSRSTTNSLASLKPPSRSAVSAAAVKKKSRPESKGKRELRELHTQQQRLADWLSGEASSEKRGDNDDADKTLLTYSIEVEARIHDTMESNKDRGLWGDPVASLIAREMTSESVFGGFIPTRRLAYPSPTPASLNQPSQASSPTTKALQPDSGPPDSLLPEPQGNMEDLTEDRSIEIPVYESNSLIHERALEIRQEAQHFELAGNIEDALATLQSGIRQLLFDFQKNQDEIQARGFDFSQNAHTKITKVQLRYKARHRRRVQQIVLVQRVWRKFQAKRAFLDTKNYKNLNAKVIQRYYRTRYFQNRRTRAAKRIQTCFRVFQEQKLWIYLHRACRLLVNDERKKHEKIRRRQVIRKRLWVKLSSILKLIWLWKSRFKALVCIQSHWKGSRARVKYAKLLAVKCEAEQIRLARELEFVQPRLENAMKLYRKFLRKIGVGEELVRWQMNKPWLRFKRLRHGDWHKLELNIKTQALCGVLVLKDTNRLSARLLRVTGYLLGIEASKVDTIRIPMRDPSAERFVALYEDLLLPSNAAAWAIETDSNATPVLSSRFKRVQVTKWLGKREAMAKQWAQNLILSLSCTLLLVYWHAVLWPISYVLTRRSPANKKRALSILEQQQRIAMTKCLRHTFRQLGPTTSSSSNRPSFACQHCFEAFATALAWNLHLRICKREYSGQLIEWDAVQADIAFLSPKSRLLRSAAKIPQEYYRDFSTFEPESSDFVQQLRLEKWWSDRKRALRILISMAVCCSISPTAAESLDATSLGLQSDSQQQQVALALIAYLLLPLRPRSELHPLVIPQLHAFVDWTQPSAFRSLPEQWIPEHELFAKLLLVSKSRRPLGLERFVDMAKRVVNCWWQRAKTWALSLSPVSSSLKYKGASVLPEA